MLFYKNIDTPLDIKKKTHLSADLQQFIKNSRNEICQILNGNSKKTVIISGPCSVHNVEAAVEYAKRLSELQRKVKDHFCLAMRVYFEKTISQTGWQGMLYDPHLNGEEDVIEGIAKTRELMVSILNHHIPIASEIIDPLSFHFFDDLLSWICIGLKSTTSQIHRQNVSGMGIITGFKNDSSGSITMAIDSIIASDISHTYIGIDENGRLGTYSSVGNPFVHLILRGGKNKPNYYSENVEEVVRQLEKNGLNPYLMIDCSHDNCNNNIDLMPVVFKDVIQQIHQGYSHIKGIMIESNILSDSQPYKKDPNSINPWISITDPCISWEETESMILEAHRLMSAA